MKTRTWLLIIISKKENYICLISIFLNYFVLKIIDMSFILKNLKTIKKKNFFRMKEQFSDNIKIILLVFSKLVFNNMNKQALKDIKGSLIKV